MKTILGYIIDKLDTLVLRLDVWYAKKYGKRYYTTEEIFEDLGLNDEEELQVWNEKELKEYLNNDD